MAIFVIVLGAVLFIVYLLNSSKKALKNEVISEGGLHLILFNAEFALNENEYYLSADNIDSLEYQKKHQGYILLNITIKITFELQNPYQMQMFRISNGSVYKKTIPYIINTNLSIEQYNDAIIRMEKEIGI